MVRFHRVHEVLLNRGFGGAGDLRLLRLMQKTGPVWKDLTDDVATSLLAVIQELLGKGTHLPRVMPWLWCASFSGFCKCVRERERERPIGGQCANIQESLDNPCSQGGQHTQLVPGVEI